METVVSPYGNKVSPVGNRYRTNITNYIHKRKNEKESYEIGRYGSPPAFDGCM